MKALFACTSCHEDFPRKLGRCPSCKEWKTITELTPEEARARAEEKRASRLQAPPGSRSAGARASVDSSRPAAPNPDYAAPLPVSLEELDEEEPERIPTGIAGLDRVLGTSLDGKDAGGAAASLVLVAGDPGTGKSTLLVQALAEMGKLGLPSLYVSGEESGGQVGARAARVRSKHKHIHFACMMRSPYVEHVVKMIEEAAYAAVVIDSIQTLLSMHERGAKGSPNQVKAVVHALSAAIKVETEEAEEAEEDEEEELDETETTDAQRAVGGGYEVVRSVPTSNEDEEEDDDELEEPPPPVIFLVCHVNKEGDVAGPKTVEHLVDCVLYFEQDENDASIRHLRVRGKNRFGASDQSATFKMASRGLIEVRRVEPDEPPKGKKSKPAPKALPPKKGTKGRATNVRSLEEARQRKRGRES